MEEKKIVFHIIQDLVSIRNCKTIHAYVNLLKAQNRAIFFVLFVLLCVCKAASLLFLLLKMPPNLNISSFFQLVICWNKNGWSGEATSLWSGLNMTENVTKCPQFFSSYFICYTKLNILAISTVSFRALWYGTFLKISPFEILFCSLFRWTWIWKLDDKKSCLFCLYVQILSIIPMDGKTSQPRGLVLW